MELSIVKTMVTKAFDNDLVSGYGLKPFRNVMRKLKKGSNARKTTIPIKDYIRLVDVAHNHLRPVIITAMNTGMRKGELRQLQWDHIDMKKGFIRLPADLTKEGTAKIIPINHHVKAALNALPYALKHGFVFTFQGEPIKHKDSLNKSFQTACAKAKIPYGRKEKDGITFHDIRRTVKTNMLAAGVDKVYRDTILGLTLVGMDVHYMAPTEETLTKAMGRYTAWLDDQMRALSENVDQNVD
jgi:integrase